MCAKWDINEHRVLGSTRPSSALLPITFVLSGCFFFTPETFKLQNLKLIKHNITSSAYLLRSFKSQLKQLRVNEAS